MSNPETPIPPTLAPMTSASSNPPKEIRIVSHSGLFYWWPVWFFGFVFSLWTYVEGNRLVVFPKEFDIVLDKVEGKETMSIQTRDKDKLKDEEVKVASDRLKKDTEVRDPQQNSRLTPKPRVSGKAWMGPLYLTILCLVIVITNVPLRGLWSLVTVIGSAMMALIFSLLGWWDDILMRFGDLHVYINMAGYLFLSTVLFIAWAVAVYIFDRRAYVIFTPGQIKVCEEVGGRERVYDTTGMSVEKQRDDWFRHIILGFGSGDMTIKTAGADRHEIMMPNVAFIGFKIGAVEQMLQKRLVTSSTGS